MKERKPLFWWSFLIASPTVQIGHDKYARAIIKLGEGCHGAERS